MQRLCFIVVAGGSGSRFGADLPKQFCDLAGRPVLMHTIERLRSAVPQADVVIALRTDCMDLWDELCRRHGFISPRVTPGGETRWHSVKNAIEAVSPDTEIIGVHDAARPVIDAPMIKRLLDAIDRGAAGAIPAVAVTDSLRMIDPGNSAAPSHAVDRSLFRAVQTPQMFRADMLRRAYSLPYRKEFTDDASVMEHAGFGPLELTEGNPLNIKITHPLDLKIASLSICSDSGKVL